MVLSEKFNISLPISHVQKYKFVDFLYTYMKNFIQNPDYREVLTRTLHAFIDNFPRNTCRELNLVQCDVIWRERQKDKIV